MRLLLAEEIFLLTHQDSRWTAGSTHAGALLGGALLAELALAKAVEIEEKRGWLHRPTVLTRTGGD
jgi:Golgi phosphoprotein 3 (GPP34)